MPSICGVVRSKAGAVPLLAYSIYTLKYVGRITNRVVSPNTCYQISNSIVNFRQQQSSLNANVKVSTHQSILEVCGSSSSQNGETVLLNVDSLDGVLNLS